MDFSARPGTRQRMMGIDNVMANSTTNGNGASLSCDFTLTEDKARLTIAIGILPTQDVYPARGLRIGVQIDDQPMIIVDALQGMYDCFREYTEQNLAISKVLKLLPREAKLALNGYWKGKKQMRCSDVFDNQRWLTTKSASEIKAGKHTLRIIMIDPEIILEQVVINPDNNRYSYFGASLV